MASDQVAQLANVGLWIAQGLLVAVFGFSAAVKGTQPKQRVLQLGMSGVVNIPVPLMRFTALCEVFGVIGLVLPYATGYRALPDARCRNWTGHDHDRGGGDPSSTPRTMDRCRQRDLARPMRARCDRPMAVIHKESRHAATQAAGLSRPARFCGQKACTGS
jgi:hypothetical protein